MAGRGRARSARQSALERSREPSRPGIDRSEQVPELAQVVFHRRAGQRQPKARLQRHTACDRLVAAFLIACASSSTIVCQAARKQLRLQLQQAVACTPARRRRPGPSIRRHGRRARPADARQVGAKRAALASSSGRPRSAPPPGGPLGARSSMTASACTVLPRPMSSARQAPAPSAPAAPASRSPRAGSRAARPARWAAAWASSPGRLDARNLPLPGPVCLDLASLLQQGAQRRCAQRMHAAPGPVRIRHRGKPAELGL